jgi:hypothetical protein
MTAAPKITYTSASGNLEEFHREFDAGLSRIRDQSGQHQPFYVGGSAVENAESPLVDRSPLDTSLTSMRQSSPHGERNGRGPDFRGEIGSRFSGARHP